MLSDLRRQATATKLQPLPQRRQAATEVTLCTNAIALRAATALPPPPPPPPPPSCRRRRTLIVFIIIVQDGRAAVCSDARASTMVLWIGRCGGCGEAGERRRGGRMVDGVVMERLREGRRLRTIGGGGGGRRVER